MFQTTQTTKTTVAKRKGDEPRSGKERKERSAPQMQNGKRIMRQHVRCLLTNHLTSEVLFHCGSALGAALPFRSHLGQEEPDDLVGKGRERGAGVRCARVDEQRDLVLAFVFRSEGGETRGDGRNGERRREETDFELMKPPG